MAQKTKATMPGRQCSTENKEQNQHTRPVAGGQRSSDAKIIASSPETSGTAAMAQLIRNNQSPEFSVATISKIVGYIFRVGGTALQHTQYFPQWGECEPVEGTVILRTSFRVAQLQLGTSRQNWGNQDVGCGTYTKKVSNGRRFQYYTKSAKPRYLDGGDRCEENHNGQHQSSKKIFSLYSAVFFQLAFNELE
ncbi:hypothetical protein IF802_26090, partial [Citrobacter freundii]